MPLLLEAGGTRQCCLLFYKGSWQGTTGLKVFNLQGQKAWDLTPNLLCTWVCNCYADQVQAVWQGG